MWSLASAQTERRLSDLRCGNAEFGGHGFRFVLFEEGFERGEVNGVSAVAETHMLHESRIQQSIGADHLRQH